MTLTPTLPAAAYIDPDVYRRERERVFGTEWQLAGFRAQLQSPGDYVAHALAGWTIVVAVQDDGSLRAFHNVCRHRAGPLVVDDHGNCNTFVCRYHGWTYDRDGALLTARDFGEDLTDMPLHRVEVAEWRGLVFVNLSTAPPPLPFDHGAFFAAFAEQPIEALTYSHRLIHDLDVNWKVYCDNYGEGYHVPLVHPRLNKELVAKAYRVDVHDHYCVHSAPTRDGAVNAGLWLWRYPNLALNVYPEGMNVERIIPMGPSRTRVIYDYFFADAGAVAVNAEVERMGREILDEDRAICEAVQRNLESGEYEVGVLSPRHENGLAAFHEWWKTSMELPSSP